MPSKIFATINGALAVFLLVCSVTGTRNVEAYYDSGAIACAVVAVGCWKHKRWLAILGAAPIIVAGVVCAVTVNSWPIFNPRDAGTVNLIVFPAVALTIASIVVAGKPSEPEPSTSSFT